VLEFILRDLEGLANREVVKKGSQKIRTDFEALRANKFVVIIFYFITSRIIFLGLMVISPRGL
jgi:hypothetical protein